jgi:hypothetical protein
MIISFEGNVNLLILVLVLISEEKYGLSDNNKDNEFDFFTIILDVEIEVVNFKSKFDFFKDIIVDEINEL